MVNWGGIRKVNLGLPSGTLGSPMGYSLVTLGIIWSQYGGTLETLWEYSGNTFDVL